MSRGVAGGVPVAWLTVLAPSETFSVGWPCAGGYSNRAGRAYAYTTISDMRLQKVDVGVLAADDRLHRARLCARLRTTWPVTQSTPSLLLGLS